MRVDLAYVPPARVSPDVVCLVVDVLRATSVLATLFGRGIAAVWPAASIEEGRTLRETLLAAGIDHPLLIGEEQALPPPGYDFGNSPIELARVPLPAGAVHATTNGTPALLACREAALVAPAAPLNAATAIRVALDAGRDVLVVCAGLYRVAAEDDTLAGGLIVDRLVRAGVGPGPEARDALARYEPVRDDLAAALRATPHGRHLVELGFGVDVDRCGEEDVYDVAAALRLEDGRWVLRRAGAPPR